MGLNAGHITGEVSMLTDRPYLDAPQCPIIEEVAAFLAKGFHRLRTSSPKLESCEPAAEESAQLSDKELDSSDDQSLHCDVG